MASNVPSADEQLLLELVNRFRMAPAAEAALLAGATAQSDVLGAISYFGVSVSAFQSALATLSPVAPLAWNENLATSADGHNQAMITADEQTHQATGEPGLGQRAINAGYSYSTLGENVFAFATNVVYAHAGFIIDWGYDSEDYNGSTLLPNYKSLGDGMQDPAGHRVSLINASFTEIGISLTAENNNATSVGPLVVTEDLGARFGYQAQFLGVVINDVDHDHFYDVGEGLGGVTVTLQSGAATYVTTTWASGGYQVAVPSGTYSITFSGGALTAPVTHQATLGSVNVKVDAEAGSGSTTLTDHAANDFNGDGRSDILWRNDNGQLSNWLGKANGGFISNDANAFFSVPTSWHVSATGDFNGDGRSDILWRNDSGAMSDWLGNANGGFTPNDGNAYSTVPTSWKIAGTGDFNGDGRDDILWRNDNGQLSNWLGKANGGFTPNDANAFSSAPTNWNIAGTGDFNGDGRDDILWRASDGSLSNWLGTVSGGFSNNDANAFSRVPAEWNIVGIGDFNGDGRDDILWRNSSSGALSDWLGNASGGFSGNDANAFTTVPASWQVAATGDYNGDGRDDILWRNTNGQLSDWLGTSSGGFIPNDANAFTSVSNDWHIQATAHIFL